MALPSIGEIQCPSCDFGAAQVKETKKGLAMVYCDACDYQAFTRSKKSDAAVRAKMKNIVQDPIAVSDTPGKTPEAAPAKVKDKDKNSLANFFED